jgi:hypothetical protein
MHVVALRSVRVVFGTVDGVNDILGGQLLTIMVPLEAVAQMEGPDARIALVGFPAFGQQRLVFTGVGIEGAEAAIGLTPDHVHLRRAVGVGIPAGEIVDDADCHRAFGCRSARREDDGRDDRERAQRARHVQ